MTAKTDWKPIPKLGEPVEITSGPLVPLAKVAQHTPGPWEWEDGLLMSASGVYVLTPKDTKFKYEVECSQPNRALIAAAPDLLAALNAIAFQAESVAGLATCGEVKFLLGLAKNARAAIARAEE